MLNKKFFLKILCTSFALLTFVFFYQQKEAKCWGFWAHKRINRLAVFTLPPEMIGFYKKNIEFVTDHAIDPDKRRYASEDEAPRHYIDIDHYDTYPFTAVPKYWDDAVEKYTEDTLKAYGILPWHLEKMLFRLTKAFEDKNTNRILRLSADIGHYIGDGHVPLHTTKNYNGQLTGQKGIHGFWESRVPEMYGMDYDYFVGKAEYFDNANERIWGFVLESAVAVDSVLLYEAQLTESFPSDQKYAFEEKGQTMLQTYSKEFTTAYSEMLDGMIERRMRKAILNVGSFWMTAWVNAGQPDLSDLGTYDKSDKYKKETSLLDKIFNGGKIKGREH